MQPYVIKGLQNFIESMGKEGCYFLSLCKLFSAKDIITTALECNKRGYLFYNWKDPDDKLNFNVDNPEGIIEYITGKKCRVTKHYAGVPVEKYYVEKWYNSRTGFSHFRLRDWDPLLNSVTVKEGKIKSWRVIKIL